MSNRKRKIAMGVGAAALILGGVAGVAGIAGADQNTKSVDIVDGFGKVTDDFSDHEREAGVLCDGCENSSDTDLVTLWQSILAADGHLTADAIDGDFGKATTKATAAWQENYGLKPTGEVDRATWDVADNALLLGDDGYSVSYTNDGKGSIMMERDPDEGEYMLYSVTDSEQTEVVPSEPESHIMLFEASFVLEPAE